MKITITNGAILSAIAAINKFSTSATGKMSYAMYRTLRKLQEEIKDYEKSYNDLIMKYGKDVGERNYSVTPDDKESYQAFMTDLMPILNTAIEVDVHQVEEDEFDLPELPKESGVTMNDYMILEQVMVIKKDIKKKS